ncbi:hypothetical protein BROSI_A0849 [Candidatus Brocadia sinica JPN1]|uniref:Uncharacterized protein n=1 Tax=Candidatus Brocadia sinica JPN1 TaxID=1197129 RepID=A0ABQ0JUD2_9BACT|nr:hypothetical protein BROSI_A0849 [Candidatus Brocadia sinica JPN1]
MDFPKTQIVTIFRIIKLWFADFSLINKELRR